MKAVLLLSLALSIAQVNKPDPAPKDQEAREQVLKLEQ